MEVSVTPVASVSRYHPVLVVLHWVLAFLVVAALILGALKMAPLPSTSPQKPAALRAHMAGGIVILALMGMRLVVRRLTARPAPARAGSPALDRLARLSHTALYGLVIAMALSGLTLATQTGVIRILAGNHPTIPEDFWAFPLRSVHYLISRALMSLIALHLTAVLYHSFLRRDHLLGRMGFGTRALPTPSAERQ